MATVSRKTVRAPSSAAAKVPAKAAKKVTNTAKVAAVPATKSKPAAAPTAQPMATPAAKPAKPAKAPKASKPPKVRIKLVRDSFAMPEADFTLIATLKARALDAKRPAKKSELLRAGLQALGALPAAQLAAALDALAPIKTGRPKKGH